MSNNMTQKDLQLVSELLDQEANLCKKYTTVAGCLEDQSSVKMAKEIAKSHRDRFNNLFTLLA